MRAEPARSAWMLKWMLCFYHALIWLPVPNVLLPWSNAQYVVWVLSIQSSQYFLSSLLYFCDRIQRSVFFSEKGRRIKAELYPIFPPMVQDFDAVRGGGGLRGI